MRARRVVLGLLTTIPLAAPAASWAAVTPLGVSSKSLDVVMSQDGSAHVAYFTSASSPDGDVTLHVCRIPAGATACTETAAGVLPRDTVSGPWITSANNRVTAVAGSSDGASEGTYAITSATGLGGYSAVTKVAPITATDVELAPAGNRLYVASRYQPVDQAMDDASFSSAPVPGMGGPGDGNASALLESSPDFSGDAQQVGVRPDGRPLTFVTNSGSSAFTYSYGGTPFDNAQLNDPNQWGDRVDISLGDPFKSNGSYEAATGSGRLWFGYEALSTDVLVRQYSGSGFGAALNPDCTTKRSAAGAQGAPALAVGRTGLLHIAYAGSDGTNQHLGYFLGAADGSAFSPYQEIYTGPDDQEDVEIAADPTSDTGGIVVWTADRIGGGPLTFSRLPAATPAPCPPPKVEPGPGGASTPPVTPPVTPVAPVTPAVKKVRTTSSTSGGAKYSLESPNVCVPAGGTFTVTLKVAKVKRKNNVFVKVTRVDFSGTGIKTRIDRKAPYKQTLRVKVGTRKGATVSVRARAFIKVKRGKAPKKSIGAKVKVCG